MQRVSWGERMTDKKTFIYFNTNQQFNWECMLFIINPPKSFLLRGHSQSPQKLKKEIYWREFGGWKGGNKHLPMKHCPHDTGSVPLPVGYTAHGPQESHLTSSQSGLLGTSVHSLQIPRAGTPWPRHLSLLMVTQACWKVLLSRHLLAWQNCQKGHW